MKRNTFLSITSIIGILFGLGLCLYARELLVPNGIAFTGEEMILARSMGAIILSISIGVWFARNAAASEAMKGILWIIFLMHASSMAIDIYYYSAGYLEQTIFGGIIVHILLGGGAFYYLVKLEPQKDAAGRELPAM